MKSPRLSSCVLALLIAASGCRTRLLDVTDAGADDAAPPQDLAPPMPDAPFAQTCADPWPIVGHDGRHSGRGCTAGPRGPSLKWKTAPVMGAISAPVVAGDGTLYAVSHGLQALQGTSTLHAFAPGDGHELWSADLGIAPGSPYDLGPVLGPGGVIYAINDAGALRSFAPGGAVRWTVTLCSDIQPWLTVGPDGVVYVPCDDKIYAISPEGGIRWRAPLVLPNLLALGHDGILYIDRGGELTALRAADGSVSFGPVSPLRNALSGVVGSVGEDNVLHYVGKIDARNYALVATAPGTGAVNWQIPLPGYVYAPPYGPDGTIYVGGGDTLLSLDENGGTRFKLVDSPRRWSGAGLVVDGEGTIYSFALDLTQGFPYGDDWLYSISPTGHINWSAKLGPLNLRNPCALGPDGTLYVGGQLDEGSRIYAFGR